MRQSHSVAQSHDDSTVFQQKEAGASAVTRLIYRSMAPDTGNEETNTGVLGHVCTYLEIAWATVPGLLQGLESQEVLSFPSGEIRIPDAVYERIASTAFSRQVLSSAIHRLLALRLSAHQFRSFQFRSYCKRPSAKDTVKIPDTPGRVPAHTKNSARESILA